MRIRQSFQMHAVVFIAIFSLFACNTSSTEIALDGDIEDESSACDFSLTNESAKMPTEVKWVDEKHVEYAKLHTGRFVTPAGTYIKGVGTMPTGMAISPNGKHLAVVCSGGKDWSLENENNQSIRIIDTANEEIAFTVEEREAFLGAAYTPEGTRLFVSGGLTDKIYVYDVTDNYKKLTELVVGGYPFDVATTPNGKYLLVGSSHRAEVWQFDIATLTLQKKFNTLTYPYEIIVDSESRFAYVSNIGNDAISVLDLNAGTTVGNVSVGKNPEGMALVNGKLYVANNDEDTLSIIDVVKLEVTGTIDLRTSAEDAPGLLPIDVRASSDNKKVYVSLGGDNAIAVVDINEGKVIGKIPTAFYPTAVIENDNKLFVANSKGVGTGGTHPFRDEAFEDRTENGASVGIFFGGVNIVPIPDDEKLTEYTNQVHENNSGALTYFGADCDNWNSPIPTKIGERSEQIRHVVYVVKENKTYDVLLGDLEGSEGDKWHEPSLAYFGEDATIAVHGAPYGPEEHYNITPNAHEITRRWVDLVNFYDNSIKSTEGHMWLTAGWLNDFGEKFSLLWQVRQERNFMLPNVDPVSTPKTGDIFSYVLNHDRSVRVYGEFVGSASSLFSEAFDFIAHGYQVGITKYDDSKKVDVFIKELEAGIFRDFTYIWIPNDHTLGMKTDSPHPAYMVADNDEALGKIVEAISHSPYWKSTAIFVFQDDPQNTPDHIDTHRSICHVIGPWVRKNYRSEILYDFASIHRTMLQILGLPPISRYDALSQPMYDLFTMEPDFSPYDLVPRDEKFVDKSLWIVPKNSKLTKASEKFDFKIVDDQGGLGRVLWRAMKGDDIPYPAHLVADGIDDDEDEALERTQEAKPAVQVNTLKGGE